jgi:GT2 family glycosyltransferase
VILSVVITHHRDIDLLRKCLKALQKELIGIDAEIIVILSEYQPEMLENFRQEFSEVKFLTFKNNLYYVRSANRGMKETRGEFVLIMNDDVIVSENSLELMLGFLKNRQEIGMVGPKILYPDGTSQASCFRFYSPLTVFCRRSFLGKLNFCQGVVNDFLYKDKDFNVMESVEVEWLSNGAGVLVRKKIIEKVGLLDERYCHYFSDVDWCRRFWQNGFKVVYFPKAIFYHYHGKRSGQGGMLSLFFNKLARTHLGDGIKYFWKWGMGKSKK